jgi:ketosteroid isomerase-like protein
MKSFAVIALVAALFAGPALAQDRSAATAEAVRQADIAFAKRATEVGFARSFLEFMDETEGLLYGMEGPPMVGARAAFEALGGDAPSGMTVEWAPTQAWGSESGDLGVTVGVYRRIPKDATRPVRTGRYVTVWRKNAAGEWKGLIDIGESDPVVPPPAAP